VKRPTLLLAIALLLGTALLGVGAVMHPMLAGDAGDQLRVIADTRHWRGLHLAMLAGCGLVAAGVWVRVIEKPVELGPLVAALAIVSVGECINALNIAYMAGSGWHMAALFATGRAEMRSLFEVTHPIGLMAARFGNFLVALGALALGIAEWQDAHQPRWIAGLAWIAGAGGLVGVLCFDEASRMVLGAVALLSGWQLVTALRAVQKTR
jgi:hypothetical protein